MRKKRLICNFKKGTIMIAAMMALIVIGIISAQLAPSIAISNLRQDQARLRSELAGFREAIDLERLAGEYSPCKDYYASLTIDPTNRVFLDEYLRMLEESGFLRSRSALNSIIREYRWGTETGKLFWEVSLNLLQPLNASFGQSSFEAGWVYDNDVGTLSPPGWKNALDPMKAIATLSPDFPTNKFPELDDYSGQNKMGQLLRGKGYSLRLQKK